MACWQAADIFGGFFPLFFAACAAFLTIAASWRLAALSSRLSDFGLPSANAVRCAVWMRSRAFVSFEAMNA